MKKLAMTILGLALVIGVFSVAETSAQIVGTWKKTVKANASAIYKISGKKFGTMTIKQTKGEKFKYELRRGSEFLSSGHTTGSNIKLRSDGKSTYTITIINEEDKARTIELSFINDGTEPL